MLPLAERLRPKTLNEYIGQKHLVGDAYHSARVAAAVLYAECRDEWREGGARRDRQGQTNCRDE